MMKRKFIEGHPGFLKHPNSTSFKKDILLGIRKMGL